MLGEAIIIIYCILIQYICEKHSFKYTCANIITLLTILFDWLSQLAFPKVNPLIHFGLCNGTRSSPPVRFFTPQGIESELRVAAREFFQKDGIEVDLAKRTVYLTHIFKW